jgi:hypothetical protein
MLLFLGCDLNFATETLHIDERFPLYLRSSGMLRSYTLVVSYRHFETACRSLRQASSSRRKISATLKVCGCVGNRVFPLLLWYPQKGHDPLLSTTFIIMHLTFNQPCTAFWLGTGSWNDHCYLSTPSIEDQAWECFYDELKRMWKVAFLFFVKT